MQVATVTGRRAPAPQSSNGSHDNEKWRRRTSSRSVDRRVEQSIDIETSVLVQLCCKGDGSSHRFDEDIHNAPAHGTGPLSMEISRAFMKVLLFDFELQSMKF